MAELGRNGHRQRMRAQYLSGSMETAPDHHLLELFLSLVIPQKDVKPLAYDLLNTFGSLEQILSAKPEQLMQVKGVGESTAVALSMVQALHRRVAHNKNKSCTAIKSVSEARIYCRNLLQEETLEKLYVITLDNDGSVLRCHLVCEGTVNASAVNNAKIIECITMDHAAGIILTHNHPHCSAQASLADNRYTEMLISLLRKINVNFIDHIIVGESDTYSFMSDAEFTVKHIYGL